VKSVISEFDLFSLPAPTCGPVEEKLSHWKNSLFVIVLISYKDNLRKILLSIFCNASKTI
jgi:hypothetical protein